MISQRIKVLHVLCSDRFSGAENVVCQIIRAFADDARYEMMYSSPDGQIREALAERSVHFVSLKKMSISELRRVIKKVKPDIVHAHDMRASFITALTCGKLPFVSQIHNNSFDSRKRSVKTILYRFAAKKAKHIFWVSDSAFKGYYYHKEFASKSSVLYNVIDIDPVKKKAEIAEHQDSYDIVYVGRLSYPKNPRRVVSIIENVVKKGPTIRAAIVGAGELSEKISHQVSQSDVGDRIHMLGFLENPLGIMKNAKVMVMASLWEGMPIAALEAMILGVPLVCTPTDGLCELVIHGETGYLSTSDSELSNLCYQIISNDQTRDKLSAGTYARAIKMMNLGEYHDSISKIYDKCVQ